MFGPSTIFRLWNAGGGATVSQTRTHTRIDKMLILVVYVLFLICAAIVQIVHDAGWDQPSTTTQHSPAPVIASTDSFDSTSIFERTSHATSSL
jgi:hypothetical protein